MWTERESGNEAVKGREEKRWWGASDGGRVWRDDNREPGQSRGAAHKNEPDSRAVGGTRSGAPPRSLGASPCPASLSAAIPASSLEPLASHTVPP